MTGPFSGFPKDTFTFMSDLRANNNRDWFNANKDRYTDNVVAPMTAFIAAMAPRMQKLAPAFVVDPKPHGGSMFRIYRDTRFAKDKSPYKEHIACHFRHMVGRDAHAPGFYVHLQPDTVLFGGGIWTPPTAVLNQIRQTIVEEPKQWARITGSKTFARHFGEIQGDQLKRPPRGYDPEHAFIEDLKRKTFFAGKNVDPKVALQPGFVKEVSTAFAAAAPFMEFITTALALDW